MYSSTERKLRRSSYTKNIPLREYRKIVGYLRDGTEKKAKFYRQKHQDKKLVAIRFEPEILDSEEGIRLVKYLIESEQRGDKIFVQRPDEKLRRVSFRQKF
jgi:hypothetical protein